MEASTYGAICLIPVAIFFIIALGTRKTITALLVSGLSGYVIVYGKECIWPIYDGAMDAITDWDNQWIILIILLFGAFIQLLREAKGMVRFGEMAAKIATTQKKTLLLTWLLGVIIFIDDYLSSLTLAATMKPLSDKQGIPREMLCYVMNTTSAPVCVIIPISAWVVYFAGIFGAQPELAPLGDTGLSIYYSSMPYFFYCFLCVLFIPLVILGVVPKMGGIKKAYKRVEETGQLWPDTSAYLNVEGEETDIEKDIESTKEKKPQLWTFVGPLAVVIFITIWQSDILLGVMVGIAVQLIYIPTKVMSFTKFCDSILKGFEEMLYICVMLAVSVLYRDATELTQLPEFVVEVTTPYMSAALLPVITFIVVGLLCFLTSNIWSLPALTAPIIFPLAAACGASLPLTVGAMMSAAIFGAQACFYSDVTLIASGACKINNVDYGMAQMPYIIIVTVISAILFLVAGIVMA